MSRGWTFCQDWSPGSKGGPRSPLLAQSPWQPLLPCEGGWDLQLVSTQQNVPIAGYGDAMSVIMLHYPGRCLSRRLTLEVLLAGLKKRESLVSKDLWMTSRS